MELQNRWNELATHYTDDEALINKWWNYISDHYSKKSRAYHNLIHLSSMFREMDKHAEKLENSNCLSFSIFFHDVIYKSLRKDNEEKSAEVAIQALTEMTVQKYMIQMCSQQINSTKKHEPLERSGNDCLFLIDFDLEILSREWEEYEIYTKQIRKEYKMVPYPIYRNGRKDAMIKFLEKEKIYQTEFYQKEKEESARKNILKEINSL